MDFLTKLADLAGVTHVVTENYSRAATGSNHITMKNLELWKLAVGKAKITETTKGILEAAYDDRQIGRYDTNADEGWLDGDVDSIEGKPYSNTEDEFGDDDQPTTSSTGDNGEDDNIGGSIDDDLEGEFNKGDNAENDDNEEYDGAEALILCRQLEDLHRQCSAEVDEIVDHYKRDRQFGSRCEEDVEDILDLYKDLYVALFGDKD